MANCFIYGKSEPVMKVVCSECADRTCASCKHHGYDEKTDVLFCMNPRGLRCDLSAADYCSKYEREDER